MNFTKSFRYHSLWLHFWLFEILQATQWLEDGRRFNQRFTERRTFQILIKVLVVIISISRANQVSIYFGVCWNCIFLLEWEDLKNLNEKLTLYLMTGCSGVWKSCYIQTRKTETRWSKGSLDDCDLQLQRLNLFF